MYKSKNILIAFILSIHSIFAQNDSLPDFSSDRPTQTISPFLVGKGFFQIETGAIYNKRNDASTESKELGLASTLLRYGILQNLELRLESGFKSTRFDSVNVDYDSAFSGLGAVTAGFKVFICNEKGIRPALAIVGSITLRHLGNESYAPTYSFPVGNLAASHTLTKRLSLAYNIGFAYNGSNADGYFIYSVFTGYKISKKWWSFVELYGNFDHGDFPNHKLDGGFTYLVGRNLQIDFTGGYGLDTDVNRFFINGGISWRIPR